MQAGRREGVFRLIELSAGEGNGGGGLEGQKGNEVILQQMMKGPRTIKKTLEVFGFVNIPGAGVKDGWCLFYYLYLFYLPTYSYSMPGVETPTFHPSSCADGATTYNSLSFTPNPPTTHHIPLYISILFFYSMSLFAVKALRSMFSLPTLPMHHGILLV